MIQRLSVLCVIGAACASSAPPPEIPAPQSVAPPASAAPVAVEPVFDPPQPALRLPTHFTPERYAARLAIDPAQPTFTGAIEISGTLDRRSAVIWLHAKQLHIHSATATRDGTRVPLVATARGADLLELRPAEPLPAGHYTLALAYDGAIQPVGAATGAFLSKYGTDRYVTSQFEATAARLVFPCLDEPGIKTPWQLTLDVPRGMVAVSNTPVAHEAPIDASHVRVEFAPTRPLPSYLVAFGVGPFDIVTAAPAASGTPLRVIVPRGQAKRVAYVASQVPRIVDALAAWTDRPYPYAKLDLLVVDADIGMENAGLIILDAANVLLDGETPSALARHGVIYLVGHEVAHQWFGDLVTAAWWDDIWLNESFATFMEDKVEMALEPTWHDSNNPVSRRWAATTSDALVTARSIRQPITSDSDIQNAFDNVTYNKGGTVLAMFEAALGPDVFQRGVRAYLHAHADGNATVADLVAALDEASGKHLAPALASFVDQPGLPELAVALACTPGKPARATISQHRYVAPVGAAMASAPSQPQQWKLPLCVAFETESHARGETCGWLDDATLELELPGSTCPAWILPDAGAHAYARTAVTQAQAIALRDRGWKHLTVPERRGVVEGVRAQALDGKLPIGLLMSFAPKLLAGGRYEIGDALGDPFALGYGTGVPYGVALLVPPQLLETAHARARAAIAPLAKRLGLAPRAGESLDDEVERVDIAKTANWAGDRDVAREAVALAANYRELPPDLRGVVLALAVDASPAVAARVRADALTEPDAELRLELFGALGAIHDPARLTAMLAVALEPHVDGRDIAILLRSWSAEPARAADEAWIRGHWSELQRAVPITGSEIYSQLQPLERTFVGACDAARRDEIAAYVTKTFAVLPSGERPAKQAIEAMDQCIAQRALVEPSLRTWLAK
jgi:alanyl aminopeptidase